MKELPKQVSESVKRRNPQLYRPCPPDRDDMFWNEDEQVCQNAVKSNLIAAGWLEGPKGYWTKVGEGTKVHQNDLQSTAKAPTSHPVVQKVSEQPKSPEDRLNKTEREFLGRLRSGVYGQMNHIGIQSVTLQLGFDTRYTPDFFTYEDHISGTYHTFWEVKGFMRDDARVKLYTAARMYPFWIFFLVQKVKGEWKQTVIHQ